MKPKAKVWFGRVRALAWAAFGLLSFAMGWQNSVALVWMASVYANVEASVASSEAADDSVVMRELAAMRATQDEILALLRARL